MLRPLASSPRLATWARPWALAPLLFSLLSLQTEREAAAELHLDGKWRQSALREQFTVQQWLDGCGPPPQSTTTGGGEVITVQFEGDELAFLGGGRVYRTNQCYDPMPTLARESHSRDANGKTWRTRCATSPNDPRKAFLNTLVVVTTESHIDIVETGRYEITLENGRCMADVKRTRSFELVSDQNAAPTASPPPPAPEPAPRPTPPASVCAAPGEAQKLEVRPSKKLLRTGESFQFRGVVLDAHGCETRTTTTWKLAPDAEGKGVSVDAKGKVTVAQGAAEGTVELIATASGKDARVEVEIALPARYDELLARSGLNSAGENDEAATATIASSSIGAGEGRAEDRARQRRFAFLGIVGVVLLVLGVITVILVRRGRRAKELMAKAQERHEQRVQLALDRRRRREADHAAQMRAHEESVAAARIASEKKLEQRAKAGPPVCVQCGRSAEPGTKFCPFDGSALEASVGPTSFGGPVGPSAQEPPPSRRGKICPTCGERFEGGADFCGKDGTHLVLIN